MGSLIDRFILFVVGLLIYIPNQYRDYGVVPVLVSVIAVSVIGCSENRNVRACCFLAFAGISFFWPPFLCFLPMICYDLILSSFKWEYAAAMIPLMHGYRLLGIGIFLVVSFTAAAAVLKWREQSLSRVEKMYYSLSDSTRETSRELIRKNRELLERQDYELKVATLTERNKIAREVHDNVGHLLSSSILQLGAMISTCRDKEFRADLMQLADTLNKSMDKVRSCVHDLYEESIDLYSEAKGLLDRFTFCPVKFDYDIDSDPPVKLKYTFISVMKEALSNIFHHSNATEARITLREHPGFYQLVVKDNGNVRGFNPDSDGIGLRSIRKRIEEAGGIVNISTENGFVIFISVPRGTANENHDC